MGEIVTKSTGSKLGPGSYNPNKDSIPLYKYKQSPSFNSKVIRSQINLKIKNANMRKTLQAQKELKKKYYELYNHSKTAKYYNQLDEESFEDSQSETEAESEYVNDATPGPGSYITGKLASTFSTRKPKAK